MILSPGGCLLWGVGAWFGGPAPRGSASEEVPGLGGGWSGGLVPGGWGPGAMGEGKEAWWKLPGTATAAGSTHPTGMHSCWEAMFSDNC